MSRSLPLLGAVLLLAGAGLFVHELFGFHVTAGTEWGQEGWGAGALWLPSDRLQLVVGTVLFVGGFLSRRQN